MAQPAASMAAAGYRQCHFSAQDGVRLAYRDYPGPAEPDGPPLLCLAGLTRNANDFDPIARHLAGRRRVVALDYRGRGLSDRADPDSYTPQIYLGDVFHLTVVARLHHMVLLGTSLGGLLSMGMSVLSPAAVRGVILNDVGPEIDPAATAKILDYVGRDHPQPDWDAAVTEVTTAIPWLADRPPATQRWVTETIFRPGDDGMLHITWDPAIGPAAAKTRADIDLWALFDALRKTPTLVLRGALSDLFTQATLERMVARRPDLATATVPNAGHVPLLDEPESLEAIDAFLNRIR